MKSYPLLEACDPTTCTAAKINWAHRKINAIYRRHLSPFEVTNSQLTILFIISKMEGIRQVDLGEILSLEKSSLSRNLVRLTSNKLINKNLKQLEITSKGKDLLESMVPAWEAAKAEVAGLLKIQGQSALDTIITELHKS